MKRKILNYLFWLVIAAAFIGPGTVTTAASAGASFQYQLIWTMIFSTLACLVLQEAAARIAIVTGASLGENIRVQFRSNTAAWIIGVSIFLGCLAYEAGNILGALSGILLVITGLPAWIFTLMIGLAAFFVLFFGRSTSVANVLGVLVGVMGLAFFVAAISSPMDLNALFIGTTRPSIPDGSIVIVLGLIGTTIVPYNIFLGSSLAEGQTLQQMRSGLTLSVLLGGVISISVMLVGVQLNEGFSFQALYQYLLDQNGELIGWLFALGLFAAGFTSTVTASMAGALTIKSIHPRGNSWNESSLVYRRFWVIILVTGVLVGLSGLKPIPVIILAQAANGLILPLLSYVIWIIINSDKMGTEANTIVGNVLMAITLGVSSVLGLLNVLKASYAALGKTFQLESLNLLILGILALVIVLLAIKQMKTKSSS